MNENGVTYGGNDQRDPPLARQPENHNRLSVQRTMRDFFCPHM